MTWVLRSNPECPKIEERSHNHTAYRPDAYFARGKHKLDHFHLNRCRVNP